MYRLYKDGEWVALWAKRPSIHEVAQVIPDREVVIELLQKRKATFNDCKYVLLQTKGRDIR